MSKRVVLLILLLWFAGYNICYSENTLTKPLPPQFETFYDDFIKYVGSKIDLEINKNKSILNNEKLPEYRRELAKSDINNLKLLKKRINDLETVRKLYNDTKSAYDSVKELAKKWEQMHFSRPTMSFLPDELVIKDITDMSSYMDTLTKGYDYYKKITDLGQKLKGVDLIDYDKDTNKLAKALISLGSVMSEFGDKVPLIGSFLKGYGDITTQFVDNLNNLKKKMDENINQGCIGTGSRLIGDIRNKAMIDQGYHLLVCREPGFRDLYTSVQDPSDVFLWDASAIREVGGEKKKGRWFHLKEVAPWLNKEQVEKAYKIYFKNGIKNPSVKDVISEIKKVVDIIPVLESKGVPASGQLKIKVKIVRAIDGRQIQNAFINIFDENNNLLINDRSGKYLTIPASDVTGKHFLYVDLDDSVKDIWKSFKKVKVEYFVGKPTYTHLSISKRYIFSNYPHEIQLLVSVKDGEDNFINKGMVTISTIPSKIGYFRPSATFFDSSISKGNISVEWIPYGPDIPQGKIRFIARYHGNRINGNYISPSEDSKEIISFKKLLTKTNIVRIKESKVFWRLKNLVLDELGNEVNEGNIEFWCKDGKFFKSLDSDKGLKKIVVPTGTEIFWQYPEGLNSTSIIKARYEGYKDLDKYILYAPSDKFILLPEIEKVSPNFNILNVAKTGKKQWHILAELVDNEGEKFNTGFISVESTLGSIKLEGYPGLTAPNQKRNISITWTEPDNLNGEKADILLKYSGGVDKFIEYLKTEKRLVLPKDILLDTEIYAEVKNKGKGLFKYELEAGVKDANGGFVKKGNLEVSVDQGSIFPGKKHMVLDLSLKNPVRLLWQGKLENKDLTFHFKYTGDRSGKQGENVLYKESSKDFIIKSDIVKTSPFLLTTQELNAVTGKNFKMINPPQIHIHLDNVQKSENIVEVESNRFWSSAWKDGRKKGSIAFRHVIYLSVIYSSDIQRSWSLLVPQLYSRYSARGIKLKKANIGDNSLYYRQGENEYYFVKYKDFMIFLSRFNGFDGKKVIRRVIEKIDNSTKQ